MPQVGTIVISDSVNTQAMINLIKTDPKLIIGKEQVSENGVKYIPIEKN